jgi:hypothetical protein
MRLGSMFIACPLLACALLFTPAAAFGAKDANAPAKTKTAAKKGAKKKPAPSETPAGHPTKISRTLRPGALTVNVGHEINDDAHVTPFPSFAGHAKKALAQNRLDSLIDAEKAARADKQADRWWTVLFFLRELDSRNDPEACFWRVVSYYRLGELAKARALRAGCEPPPGVQTVLDGEDAMSTTLQPVAALPEMAAAGEKPPEPVVNSDAYAGPTFAVMTATASK